MPINLADKKVCKFFSDLKYSLIESWLS